MESSPYSLVIMIGIVLLPLFFLPTIIACKKHHKYKIPIIIINLIGGLFYGAGWVVALIWCFIDPKDNVVGNADEIKKLFELKEKGIITKDEFERKKKDLID